MKRKDASCHQVVALVKPYKGLHVGLQGLLLLADSEKALVVLKNRSKTIEQVPLNCLIGVLEDG